MATEAKKPIAVGAKGREMDASSGEASILKAALRAPISVIYLLSLCSQYFFLWMMHFYVRAWSVLALPFTSLFVRRTKHFDPRLALANERRDALLNTMKRSFSWWQFYALGKDSA